MKFEVFNKRPSKKAVKEAMKCSDVQEQMETLAIGTAPKKGEIWKSPNAAAIATRRRASRNCASPPFKSWPTWKRFTHF